MKFINNLRNLLSLDRMQQQRHIPNLDYQPTGMFRAAAAQLTLEKVYLGNICGLFIKNARYWESSKDYIARDICLRQWQNALIANLTDYSRSLTQKR